MGNIIAGAIPGEHNLGDYGKAVKDFVFGEVEKEFSWYTTGNCNIVHEAVDRHVMEGGGGSPALYYTDGNREETYSFAMLQEDSSRFAAVLAKYGIGKGDRVGIFLPRSPELYISFLAAARIGAVVVPLFEAFMEDAVKDRLGDSGAVAVVTSPELSQRIPYQQLGELKHVFIAHGEPLRPQDISWRGEMSAAPSCAKIEWVDREHPLFILYASGADGKARGLVHVHNTMVGLLITARWVHDLKKGDIYWCTADPGWITGIAYGFLAPWLLGIPVVVRGGRFNDEDWCATLARYRVSVWYSAPTAFRLLIAGGDDMLRRYDLGKLRHILSVGEPLTPEVMEWSMGKLGVPIYDTFWMSETGMNMICNYRCLPIKQGSIGKPFPGIVAGVVDDRGGELPPGKIGNLAIKAGWPSMFRGVWGDPELYRRYFRFEPWFVTGDAAYMDRDGYFYFQGRVDGVINTSGERVGPWEVEKKLEEHPAVDRAGVAGKPDKLRGEIVKAYIQLNPGIIWSESLAGELRELVKFGLAAHAAPREFEVKEQIPLTADGDVDRKALKGWVLGLE
ncbi:acetyl-coenzyme A synthetase [Desulfocucumis palustris]|uniref:acetate--CoA ligase n=1 Tax=Desulfocucumis palustris TaxID=1898651 RepID=A0A2L2XJ50_9FIRM|nr:AMP-binding protein [Desulfocucumis palustris]GBF34286.1 acetyl-coenzyme A synthetase [Desulfocucumis palustris]